MHYVVIGAGPAGDIAAATLRKYDTDSSVTMITDEPEPPYSRMAIPYYLIKKVEEKGTYLHKEEDFHRKHNIDIMYARVEQVMPDNKTLKLNNGELHQYEKLLIASGSTPVKPPVPGIDSPGVHNCWTLEDARHIIRLAQPGAKVLLIGAGFIGCIVLEALSERQVDLTVVEMGDRMVPRMMTQTAGNMIKRWCESKGVKVFTSTRVTAIEHNPQRAHPLNVLLDNGDTMDMDLVISAAGVKSNTVFLQNSGIQMNQGIIVDHYMQTSVPDVYAAGDVAEGRDFSTWNQEVHAIQPTAVEHGRVAAHNMVGNTHYYRGSFNMNVLDTLGLISSSFGLWMGKDGGDKAELLNEAHYRYLNLEFEEDVMVGATSLGLTQHVGVLRGLIQNRIHLGKWKDRLMKDPTRIMEAYLSHSIAPNLPQGMPAHSR